MKSIRIYTAALVLAAFVGSSAHATVAREAVLGAQPVFQTETGNYTTTVVNGSLWYDDSYNVFYNPAYVNTYKDYVVVQKGLEGGWFASLGDNFVYGIYMNRGGNDNAAGLYGGNTFVAPGINTRNATLGSATMLDTQRPIDFFIGGDMGVKWGFHATWAYNRNTTGATNPNKSGAEITNSYWHFDLGAEIMGFEPFIGATILSKYKNDLNQNIEQVLDEYNLGFRYRYEAWTPYVAFKKFREGSLVAGAATQTQGKMTIVGAGVGHDTKVADGVHIFKNVGLWYSMTEDDTYSSEIQRDYQQWVVPLNLAFEADATSWLTLRAGGYMDIINQRTYKRNSATDSVNVADTKKSITNTALSPSFRIGSTFNFGKLKVDSAFGTGAVTTDGASATNVDTSSAGFDSQTFALVSASYSW